jgi:hypothetical protein
VTKITRGALLASALLFAQTAGAVAPGGKLYIKSKDTKVLDKADLKGKPVGTLQPGTEVVWQGADAKNKTFHSIEAGGVKGFTQQQNLSPKKPDAEFLAKDDGKPIDAQAFASSGAATKALSGAALNVGGDKADAKAIAKGLMTVSAIAAAVTPDAAREYNQKVGAK